MPETPPQYSDDGRQWWDGGRWLPVGTVQPVRRPRVPLAMVAALAVTLMSVVLTSVLVWASAPIQLGFKQAVQQAQQQATPNDLSDLRVCAADHQDQTSGACRANQAGQAFQARQVVCSATLVPSQNDSQSAQPTLTVAYGGHEVASGTPDHQQNQSSYTLFAVLGFGNGNLPGGKWSCKFSFGTSTKSIAFTLNGPNGPLLYGSVCSTTDVDQTTNLCSRDTASFTQPTGIACTALVIGGQSSIQVQLHYQGGAGSAFTRTATPQSQGEISPAVLVVQATDLQTPGSAMPAGSYSCVWSIGGKDTKEKDFTVS